MVKRRGDEPLNDGVAEYGSINTVRDNNGKKKGEEFTSLGFLFFNYASIRQGDIEFYGAKDITVDLKIKTYFANDVQKSHKVKFDNEVYEVISLDPDIKRTYMYWYLTKVGVFDGIQFIKDNPAS